MTATFRTSSVRSQWLKLSQDEQIQHMLSNSDLYQRYRHYQKLSRNIQPMVKVNEPTSK